MTGARDTYLKAGMNDYVSKPFDPPTLLATIERLTNADLKVQTPGITALPSPEVAAVASFDAAKLDVLKSAIAADIFPGLLESSINDVDERVERAVSLLKESRVEEARHEAHVIIGIARKYRRNGIKRGRTRS